jgi:hypothetical protein
MEHIRLALIEHVPGGGQLRDNFEFGRGRHGQERLKEVVPDPEGFVPGSGPLVGVEKRHIAGEGNAQGASRLWGRGPPDHGRQQERHEETAAEQSMSVHRGFLLYGRDDRVGLACPLSAPPRVDTRGGRGRPARGPVCTTLGWTPHPRGRQGATAQAAVACTPGVYLQSVGALSGTNATRPGGCDGQRGQPRQIHQKAVNTTHRVLSNAADMLGCAARSLQVAQNQDP